MLGVGLRWKLKLVGERLLLLLLGGPTQPAVALIGGVERAAGGRGVELHAGGRRQSPAVELLGVVGFHRGGRGKLEEGEAVNLRIARSVPSLSPLEAPHLLPVTGGVKPLEALVFHDGVAGRPLNGSSAVPGI